MPTLFLQKTHSIHEHELLNNTHTHNTSISSTVEVKEEHIQLHATLFCG